MMQPNQVKKFSVGLALTAGLLFGSWAALAQQKPKAQSKVDDSQVEPSRGFWPPEFRPAAPAGAKPRPGTYRPAKGTRPAPIVKPGEAAPNGLGVTLWLLRPAQAFKAPTPAPAANRSNQPKAEPKQDEEIARVLVKKKVGNSERTDEMIPERIEANTPLKIGQLLRLSVEVPQDGYLYVIDREKYTDGTIGDAFLIFPSNPRSDEHRVTAGRIIELPDSKEYVFEVKLRSDMADKTLSGELLSFLVSPRPLDGIPAADAEGLIRLPNAMVEEWESKWGQNTVLGQAELETGKGRARTRSEQSALTGNSQGLTQADPLPQTVFTVAVKRGSPYMVKMPLTIGK